MAIAMLSWMVAIPLLGGITGLRSMTPIALVCWYVHLGQLTVDGTWAFWTASRISLIVFTVLALGEFIGDKLPRCPNRTAPFPLLGRIVFGGLVGAICATSLNGSIIEGALLGSISAVAGTFLGYAVRHWLTVHRGLPDLGVALGEDVLSIGLAILALQIITG